MSSDSSDSGRAGKNLLLDACLVTFGTIVTLSIHGYRFGEGNHTIYLLDALRRTDPQLLRNDWFTTQTLQYHALFGWISHNLIRFNLIQPAFAAAYLLLVVLFHAAWLRLARDLANSRVTYLLSLSFYYISAAGTGLGFYQFFQDSSFLPSNVANVAFLWGICLWIGGRIGLSGACFGLAGMFHLNHAVVGIGIWLVLSALDLRARSRTRLAVASLLALTPCLINIVLAAQVKLGRGGSVPLHEFVDLYVRLRHPHHYDPSSWPVWLWLAFAWPIPLALAWMRGPLDAVQRRATRVLALLLVAQIVTLLGAGVWFVSETLVQMSLYRFSIFMQLLSCVMAGAWIVERVRSRAWLGAAGLTAGAAMIVVCLARGPFLGAFAMPEEDPEYRQLCEWARANTPVDAVFLVPPAESSFRLHAQRAIVVNFKAVPQLSGELGEWRDRLCAVLAMDDLGALPRGYRPVLTAIDHRYASLSAEQLIAAARKYRARYIITCRAIGSRPDLHLLYTSPRGRFFLYDRAD